MYKCVTAVPYLEGPKITVQYCRLQQTRVALIYVYDSSLPEKNGELWKIKLLVNWESEDVTIFGAIDVE